MPSASIAAMPWSSARTAGLAIAMLTGCRAVVDSGITYTECEQTDYVEPFRRGSALKGLLEKCWQFTDANVDDGDPSADILLEDGDLVIRSSPAEIGEVSHWTGSAQGPLAFQTFEADFVMGVRVEVFDKINADRCVPPGYRAGIALRLANGAPEAWATFMIEPFQTDPPIQCDEESGEAQLPALGKVENNGLGGLSTTTRGTDDAGIGLDDAVEADIAMCRIGSLLTFYYRDPDSSEQEPVWRRVGGDFQYSEITGPVEVGLTVAGVKKEDPGESFRTAAHFQLALISDTILTDGCEETLTAIEYPTVE